MRDKVVLLLTALGVKDIVDALLSIALQAVEQELRNKTNQPQVPEGLESVAVYRAAGQYLSLAHATGQLSDFDFSGAVQSIKEGDTTVTFLDGAADVETFSNAVSAMTQYGADQINRYRRLVW
mgnify:CR=1 FL=1